MVNMMGLDIFVMEFTRPVRFERDQCSGSSLAGNLVAPCVAGADWQQVIAGGS